MASNWSLRHRHFRTPRHIIRAIVDLVDPKIGETVYDPAAGTAGFLVAAYEHIRLTNSSANGRDVAELEGKMFERGYGDRLNAAQWRKLQTATFYGNDVDPKMVSLASMNLALRGLPDVRILKRNVLTTSFDRQAKAEKGLPLDGYDVVLANPPFSGRLDRDRIVDDVRIGTSTATELLFVKYMIDNLKPDGRCGVVVPEGVLFGSTGTHKELRRILMQNNRVEAVLSLHGGVFQPYSGVKTSVLVFAKGGRTERVMFLYGCCSRRRCPRATRSALCFGRGGSSARSSTAGSGRGRSGDLVVQEIGIGAVEINPFIGVKRDAARFVGPGGPLRPRGTSACPLAAQNWLSAQAPGRSYSQRGATVLRQFQLL
jgi:hypothetical protein